MAQTLQGDKSDITKRPFKVVSKDTKKVLLKEKSKILWMHIHLPYFFLEVLIRGAAGKRSKKACVLVESEKNRNKVILANSYATSIGVRPNMLLTAACMLGELKIFNRQYDLERAALIQLCQWAMQFTSFVSPVDKNGLTLEIGGSQNLFGSLEELLGKISKGLKELGYKAHYAVAPTPLAAVLLARESPYEIVTDKSFLSQVIGALPITALRLETSQEKDLQSCGIKTVTDCKRLPRSGLASRLSPKIVDTLDRIFGKIPDPQSPLVLPKNFSSKIDLPWEVDNATDLIKASDLLINELLGYLQVNNMLADKLDWSLVDRNGDSEHFEVKFSQPHSDKSHMRLLLREVLVHKSIKKPIQSIKLEVKKFTSYKNHLTKNMFHDKGSYSNGQSFSGFIDRLRLRLGDNAIHSIGVRSEHSPEHAHFSTSKLTSLKQGLEISSMEQELKGRRRRPLWLLKKPLRLEMDHNNEPVFHGSLKLMPERERLIGSWWSKCPMLRDYFVAYTSLKECLWIYRELERGRCWFLHGIFN